jgi:hypothetical protein
MPVPIPTKPMSAAYVPDDMLLVNAANIGSEMQARGAGAAFNYGPMAQADRQQRMQNAMAETAYLYGPQAYEARGANIENVRAGTAYNYGPDAYTMRRAQTGEIVARTDFSYGDQARQARAVNMDSVVANTEGARILNDSRRLTLEDQRLRFQAIQDLIPQLERSQAQNQISTRQIEAQKLAGTLSDPSALYNMAANDAYVKMKEVETRRNGMEVESQIHEADLSRQLADTESQKIRAVREKEGLDKRAMALKWVNHAATLDPDMAVGVLKAMPKELQTVVSDEMRGILKSKSGGLLSADLLKEAKALEVELGGISSDRQVRSGISSLTTSAEGARRARSLGLPVSEEDIEDEDLAGDIASLDITEENWQDLDIRMGITEDGERFYALSNRKDSGLPPVRIPESKRHTFNTVSKLSQQARRGMIANGGRTVQDLLVSGEYDTAELGSLSEETRIGFNEITAKYKMTPEDTLESLRDLARFERGLELAGISKNSDEALSMADKELDRITARIISADPALSSLSAAARQKAILNIKEKVARSIYNPTAWERIVDLFGKKWDGDSGALSTNRYSGELPAFSTPLGNLLRMVRGERSSE